MSNTNDRYLNGTHFTNITVTGDCVDDGSIEASGILFVNTIKEYNTTDPGVNVEDCFFEAGKAIITSTIPSTSTSASLIVYGGALILKDSTISGILTLSNTTNSYNITDGSLVINGGVGLKQNLNIGGVTTLFNTTPSYNNTSGSLISLGGISIQNTTDAISFTSGGGLTVDGGASIAKTLFANILNSNNATLSNANIPILLSNNITGTYGNINTLTSGNIVSSNISSNTLYTNFFINNYSSISNLNLTYGTFANINVINENIVNSTINNLTTSTANIFNIIATSGNIDTLTVGNLHVNNNFEYNDIVTNLSTANIINNFATINSLLLTSGTFGTLYGSNLYVTNVTNTNLSTTNLSNSNLLNTNLTNSNLLNTNLSSANTNIINETVSNSIISYASIGNLYIYNTFSANNSTINNLNNTNFTSSNSLITNITNTSLYSNTITSGILLVSGTTPSYASSIGSFITFGGIGINITENATSYTNGGSLTIAGGTSVEKDLYVGNSIFTINVSSNNAYINTSTIGSLLGDNISYSNSTFSNILLSGTTVSSNSTTGALVSYGGISINCTEDVTSMTSGGGLTDAGGATIAKSLLVGGTISSTAISTGYLLVSNASINNLITSNITNTNLLNTNSTITNLYSLNTNLSNLSASNAIISTITYGTLIGNYISANIITNNNTFTSLYSTISNLTNTNSTINSLQLINGTFGSLSGSYLNTNNATISSIISTNISTVNETTTNLLSTNISTANIIGTTANFIYATIANLNTPYLLISDATISNLNLTNVSASNVYILSETIGNSLITNLVNTNLTSNNAYLTNLSNINFTSNNGLITNLTTTNIISSNISSNSIVVTSQTVSNLNANNSTISNLTSQFINTTNFQSTNITSENLYSTNGTFINISTSNIISDNASISNQVVTNSSIANIINTNLSSVNVTNTNLLSTNATISTANILGLTAGNINFTGTLYQNGSPYISSQWTSIGLNTIVYYSTSGSSFVGINTTSPTASLDIIGTLHVSGNTIFDSNISTGNLTVNSNITAQNITIANINTSTLTSSSISSNHISSTNSTTTNLIATNSTTANSIITNLTSSNIVVSNQTISQLISTFNTLGSLITNNTTPSLNSSTASVILSGGLSINSTTNSSSFTSGGGLTIDGGLAVVKDVYIGGYTYLTGQLDLNNNIITNVTSPNNLLDVANKYYVDNRFDNFTTGNVNGNFTQGQVIVATTGGNIIGYSSFMFDNTTNLLSLYGTQDATSLTNGGTLHIYGGASIDKQLFVGGNTHILGYLDMNNQKITSVATPTTFYDAANKYYVDNRFDNFTVGNVNGNFTQGQVIVASTGGNINGYDTFTFNTSGLLTLSSTTNSTNLTTPGTFITYGGANILKTLFVGEGIDANSQLISNVTAPSNLLDVANKWYVDNRFNSFTIGNVSGNFTQGQVIVASTGGNITGFDIFTFNTSGLLTLSSTTNSTNLTTPGTFITYGGANILKTLFVGQGIDANNQLISNVTSPSNLLDVANKYYVDNRFDNFTVGNVNGNFTQGQVIVASTGGNITGFDIFTFNTTGLLTLSSTTNSTNLTTPGTFITYGGANILKTLFVGEGIDANNQVISNVTSPSNLLDVANKWYVDNKTVGNVNGNFTQGQVIIAGTGGNITGFDTFTFNTSGMLSILTSTSATSLTNGGSLTVLGGASFSKNVYIGTGLDVNDTIITSVALPINPTDAVNKEYVDYFSGVNPGDIRETSFVLNNSINTPTNVLGFSFLNTEVSSFEAIVYLQIPELNIYDQWEIHGVLKGSIWIINTTFIGDHPSKVSFSIINTGTSGQIQYTNTNNTGTATLRFRATTTSQGIYTNTTIGNIIKGVPYGGTGTDFFTQGTLLIGDGINSIKTNLNLMYVNNTLLLNNTSNATNLSTATVIFSGGVSIQKNLLIGTGIDLNMQKITNLAIPTNPYDAANKYYVDSVFSSGGSLNLNGPVSFYNTEDATGVTHGGALTIYGGTAIGKQLYVGGIAHFINTSNSTSTSTGSVIISGGLGITGNINGINSVFTNITSSNIFTTNLTSSNINTSNITSSNIFTTNLTSSNINTSNITSSNIITTNITSSNINTSNVITTNITSSNINTINITSTNTITTNITSSNINTTNITTSSAIINTVNMTPSLGDIFKEISFNASHNVNTPDNITGFIFNNNVRYFTAWLSVFISATPNLVTAFTVEGLQLNSGVWDINYRFIGANTKIKLYITNSGQIQYTCPGIPGFVSSLMKFRAITTSV